MKSSDSCRPNSNRDEVPHSSMYLPDIPLPPPPPMANIMVTSRFDLPTRGGCGYRRILNSRSTEFRSPILSRSNLSLNQTYRSPLTTKRFGSEKDYGSPLSPRKFEQDFKYSTLTKKPINEFQDYRSPQTMKRLNVEHIPTESPLMSPLYRNKNFEDLSRTLDPQQFRRIPDEERYTPRSQCPSTDSVFSQEIEEIDSGSSEMRNRTSESYSNEISPDYQNVFYNEHYISDIDENEEIKEFLCAYNRRLSEHSDTKPSPSFKYFSYNTLPSKHYSFPGDTLRSYGTNSSMKSSEYYYQVSEKKPRKSTESVHMFGNAIMKSPYRTVVKLAKIR